MFCPEFLKDAYKRIYYYDDKKRQLGDKRPVFSVESGTDEDAEYDKYEVEVGKYVGQKYLKDAFAYLYVGFIYQSVFYSVTDFI